MRSVPWFLSCLLVLLAACSSAPATGDDAALEADATSQDGAEVGDAAPADAGRADAGRADAAPTDATFGEANPADAAASDASPTDARAPDARDADAGVPDTGAADTGPSGPTHELRIPHEISACATSVVTTDTLATMLDQKARVRFRALTAQLPERDLDLDLVESLELGAPVQRLVPAAPGHFTYATEPGPVAVYTYRQAFGAAPSSTTLSLELRFEDRQPKVLDVAALTERQIAIQLEGNAPFVQSLGTCDYNLYGCSQQHFRFEGGGTLDLVACRHCPSLFICKSDPAGLSSATFSLGAERQETTDYFNLALSMRHHNWGSDAFVLLTPPVGNVHALYLGSRPYPDYTSFAEVQYLGANYTAIETHAVLSGP